MHTLFQNNRSMFMKEKIFVKRILWALPVLIVIGLLFWWKNSSVEEFRYTKEYYDVFDTVTTVTGYAETEEIFYEEAEQLHLQLIKYHQLFDIYHTYEGLTNMKILNEQCKTNTVKVDQELLDFLIYGKKMCVETNGETNIALGSVLKIWHDYREEGIKDEVSAKLPNKIELENAGLHTDIEDLIIDLKNGEVSFQDSQLQLDVGGIAKGYSVEKVAQYGKKIGMTNFLLNVGGNIRAVGTKLDGKPWIIGIQDPASKDQSEYIKTVELNEMSVVTSGDYQRYYVVKGKKYCHIIDPDDWYPANFFSSVSVIARDSGKADTYSTALFNMDYTKGKKIVEDDPDLEAMWITQNGIIYYSSGFGD